MCDTGTKPTKSTERETAVPLLLTAEGTERLSMGEALDLLIETTDVGQFTAAIRSEGIVGETDIETLADVFPGPMLRVRLSRSQLDRVLDLPGVVSIEEDVIVFADSDPLRSSDE